MSHGTPCRASQKGDSMRTRRLRLTTLLLCLALLAWPPAAQPVLADGELANPNFEGGFTDHFGDGHVVVANGWTPWYQDGPGQNEGKNFRPSFGESSVYYLGGKRVHGGAAAQKFGNLFASHNAGLWQRVSVPRGSQVTFSAWGQAWSSSEDDDNSVKDPGNYRLLVGIDPTGNTDWSAGTVRWSEPRIEYNNWVQLSVNAQAEADAVTVFVRGHCDYPVKHNESVWDDASLSVVRPTPPPPPTPRPTNTPEPTVPPTPAPTATASPTPALVDLCVLAFEDTNGNGRRDDGEGPIPGAAVSLLDAAQTKVGSLLTTGYEEPSCLNPVPAGDYTLVIDNPAGYEATGDIGGALTLVDAPVQVEMGYQRLPTRTPPPTTATPAPAPTAVPTPASGGFLGSLGRGLYGISGILVILLAAALLLVPRYLRMD